LKQEKRCRMSKFYLLVKKEKDRDKDSYERLQQTCGVKIKRASTWYGNTGSCGDGKHTQNHTQSPDKGLAINGCLQSAAPPLVPPVTVVQPNKCLTLSKNPQATANSAPPSIYCLHTACWERIRLRASTNNYFHLPFCLD